MKVTRRQICDLNSGFGPGMLVLHCLTYCGEVKDILLPQEGSDMKDDDAVDLRIIIDGVEVDPTSWLKRLSDNWDAAVKAEARKLLPDQAEELLSLMYKFQQDIEWKLEALVPK